MKNIMVDLETLSTRADSVILSIGAVKFDLNTGAIDENGFYASVSIDSNHEIKPRHISESTLIWWIQQSEEARRVFTEPKQALATALEDFQDWFDHNDYRIWSNGADFDIPMLAHAFNVHSMETPWKFWNTGCYRTMKSLPNAPKKVEHPGIAHHALHDAVAQAKHLQLIWQALHLDRKAVTV